MNKKPMQRLLILAIVTLFLLAGCGKASETANLQTSPEPTLEEIIPTIIAAPNVDEAVSRYLTYWTEKDYASMYDMLSPLSKDSISFDDFSARYQYLHNEANINNISYQILSTLTNPRTAMAAYSIHLESAIFSPIDRDTTMDLVIDNGEWKVVWAENLILPEFAGGNTLSAEYYVPERGNLYDRNGTAIAYNTNAVAVSAIPSLLEPEFVGSFAAQLAQLSDSINMNVLIDQLTAEDPDYLILLSLSLLMSGQKEKNIFFLMVPYPILNTTAPAIILMEAPVPKPLVMLAPSPPKVSIIGQNLVIPLTIVSGAKVSNSLKKIHSLALVVVHFTWLAPMGISSQN